MKRYTIATATVLTLLTMLFTGCAKDNTISSISFSEDEVVLRPGETVKLIVETTPEGVTPTTLSWTSSNPEAVTVDDEGVVTAVAFGESIITVSGGGAGAECTVVATILPESISLDKEEMYLRTGESCTFEVTLVPSDAEHDLVWTSSAPEYVSVSEDGTVTAIADGEAEITVTAARGTASATCLVKAISYEPGDYVDEWGINHGKGVTIGGATWAPVNCGYHETDYPFGKLYQWGRVDGDGYTADPDGLGEDDATQPVVKSPLPYGEIPEEGSFYLSSDNIINQWMDADENGELAFPDGLLWADLSTSEAFKDNPGLGNPCPEGWRTPTLQDFQALKLDYAAYERASTWHQRDTDATPMGQAGRYFGENHAEATAADPKGCIFLPATGSRNGNTGVSSYRNLFGEYWMDGRKETYYGKGFYIAGNMASDEFAASAMDNGLAIRCVKE